MNKQNTKELLEYLLASEGEDFEEWYSSILEIPIEVIEHPFIELSEVESLLEELKQKKELLNEQGDVAHIYFNCLVLLKDYLND